MYTKQIIIFLVVGYGILAPDITFGFEIISTTTERDVNKDGRCQQEINNLRDQQNFWISFYNDSCELRQIRKEQLLEKKLEFGKKQKELIETVNKQNSLLQQFHQQIEKISSCDLQQKRNEQTVDEKQKELIQHFNEKIGKIETKLGNIQQELLGKIETKLANIQQELLGKIETKLVNVQGELLKEFKEEIKNLGKVDDEENIKKIEHGKTSLPKSCLEILKRGNKISGVYTIQPSNTSFEVRCNMDTKDGGWTYVLNRFDGSQDFYLDWKHYRNGFGNLSGEFWLGLEHLYELTGFQDNQLLLEFVDPDNKHFHAMYNVFRIGSEGEGYPIKVLDGFSGDAGDSLTYHKNMKFSTHDRDQDTHFLNCAVHHHGAWWYNGCYYSNLGGIYFNTSNYDSRGMVWYHIKPSYISLKKVKMMVRPH